MTVLVDTSVWSLALLKDDPADHPAVKKLQSFLLDTQNIVLIGIILQEILQGFKYEGTFTKVITYLDAFPLLSLNRSDLLRQPNFAARPQHKG